MTKSRTNSFALLMAIFLLGAGQAIATTIQEIESTYLGDGWFKYRMKQLYDPFFLEADITSFGILFTNAVEFGATPANWSHNAADAATWDNNGPFPEPLPNEQTFLVRSSFNSYKLATNVISLYSLFTAADLFPSDTGSGVVSKNVVGYAMVLCLVPCPPEEADGSPTNFFNTVKLIPDITIKQLLVAPSPGLIFDWENDSTVLLQGSSDMVTWSNVTYILGSAPETTWYASRPMSDFGNYFRLQLVAGYQTTNLPPLSPTSTPQPLHATRTAQAPTTTPRVGGCRPNGATVAVTILTDPGQTGQVRVLNSAGVTLQTQSFSAVSNSVVVNFPAKGLPNPIFFEAVKN